jgi:hypothetical protein
MSDDIEVTVADETPITVVQSGDTTITISNSDSKEGYIREEFTDEVGTNVILPFGNVFRENSLLAFYNGVLMQLTIDYTELAGKNGITILKTIEASDIIEVRYVIN